MSDALAAAIMTIAFLLPTVAITSLVATFAILSSVDIETPVIKTVRTVLTIFSVPLWLLSVGAFVGLGVMASQELDSEGLLFWYMLFGIVINGFVTYVALVAAANEL